MLNINEDDIIVNIKTDTKKRISTIARQNKFDMKKEKYQRKFNNDQSRFKRRSQGPRNDYRNNDRSQTKQFENKSKPRRQQTEQQGQRKPISKPKRPARIVTGNIQLPQELQATKQLHIKKNIYPIEDFNLHQSLAASLRANHLQKLTQIQSMSFETLNNHKNGILKAATGSGKTLSYLIPIINQILNNKYVQNRDSGTIALVICPTRQLCIQAQKQTWKCLKRCAFIVPGTLMGGQAIKKQKARIRKGINILFCTPGRLDYHLKNTQSFKLNKIKFIVFEEADRTLDYGFEKDIKSILQYLKPISDFQNVQKILVSAHFNDKIQSLVKTMDSIQNFNFIGFNKQPKQTTKQINISKSLKQNFVLVSEQQRVPFLASYLGVLHQSKILVFLSTIDQVQYFDFIFRNMEHRDNDNQLTGEKVSNRNIFKLHGDIDQKARSKTYFEFRKSNNSVLFSTEVASRGLDFPDLTHIVLYDIPPTLTDYANRIGRTARMNSSGVSLLILNYQESDYVEQLKVYTPNINPIQKDTIFDKFKQILQKRGIQSETCYYIQGLVRGLVKDDPQKYQMARKAYVSMLRAYARLPHKQIFAVKKLDLKAIGKNFGLSAHFKAPTDSKGRNPSKKPNHQVDRKKRKVQNVRDLQISEYM